MTKDKKDIRNKIQDSRVDEKKGDKKEVSKAGELRAQIAKARGELAGLVLENIQHKLKNTSSLRIKRDAIARLFTALRQVEMEVAAK